MGKSNIIKKGTYNTSEPIIINNKKSNNDFKNKIKCNTKKSSKVVKEKAKEIAEEIIKRHDDDTKTEIENLFRKYRQWKIILWKICEFYKNTIDNLLKWV